MSECIIIETKKTQELLASGNAILIDIREADEHAREHIRGAQSLPLSTFKSECLDGYSKDTLLIFHCQSGNRTKQAKRQVYFTRV